MNYKDKKIAITGVSGFIGYALAGRLEQLAAEDNPLFREGDYRNVVVLGGDIREPSTFKKLDHTFDYLFHFAAPSSQVLFKRKPAYCIDSTINGFINAAEACRAAGIRLVYPSTGLLSSGQYNEYALCKKICEDYAAGLGIDALGIRLFAAYGPGEGHKADYASVPYLFARDMVEGRPPVVFGDGKQVRDFVYITDAVEAIVQLAERCHDPVVDVGSGDPVSFNHLTAELKALTGWDEINYLLPPDDYVKETAADISRLTDFYVPKTSLTEGLARVVDYLAAGRELPISKGKDNKKTKNIQSAPVSVK